MIGQIIIIICVVAILVVVLRRLPQIRQIDLGIISSSLKKDLNKEEKIEKKNIQSKEPVVKKEKTEKKFNFFGIYKTEKDIFEEADRVFQRGDYDKAEKMYLKIASVNPMNVKVYNRLGAIYMERKDYSDAKEAFKEAVRLDPADGKRYYNLAMAQIELREYRSSIESLKKATSLSKNKKYAKLLAETEKKIKYRYREMKRIDD